MITRSTLQSSSVEKADLKSQSLPPCHPVPYNVRGVAQRTQLMPKELLVPKCFFTQRRKSSIQTSLGTTKMYIFLYPSHSVAAPHSLPPLLTFLSRQGHQAAAPDLHVMPSVHFCLLFKSSYTPCSSHTGQLFFLANTYHDCFLLR